MWCVRIPLVAVTTAPIPEKAVLSCEVPLPTIEVGFKEQDPPTILQTQRVSIRGNIRHASVSSDDAGDDVLIGRSTFG